MKLSLTDWESGTTHNLKLKTKKAKYGLGNYGEGIPIILRF